MGADRNMGANEHFGRFFSFYMTFTLLSIFYDFQEKCTFLEFSKIIHDDIGNPDVSNLTCKMAVVTVCGYTRLSGRLWPDGRKKNEMSCHR